MLLDAAGLAGAALLAALLVQPFRTMQGRILRGLAVLALPVAVLAQGMAAAAFLEPGLAPWPRPALLGSYTLASAVPALVPALLLARPVPGSVGPALAVLGVAPLRCFLRLTLGPALPGLVLGWLLALLPGLVALVLASFPRD